MSIPISCGTCGYRGFSRMIAIKNSKGVTIGGGSETCPKCGGRAYLQSGTYDFVGAAISAFTAPEMTRDKIEAVRDIAQRLKTGAITTEQAKQATAEDVPALEKVWDWIGQNDKQLMIFLTIIGLLLAHYHFRNAVDGPQSDREIVQRQTQALEKIDAELKKLNVAPRKQEQPGQATQRMQNKTQAQTTAPKNRHERRKQVAIARQQNAPSRSK